MNRTAVKNFAQWARRHLHDLVRARLALFGVTEKGIETPQRIQGGLIVGGQTLTLSATDIGQYDALIGHLHALSGTPKDKFALLVDEIAYTWFNRLAALRFMEVKGYAERALSSDTPGQPDPNLLRDAMTLAAQDDLKGVTPDTLAEWQRLYQPGEVYRRLLVAHAAAYETVMPFLFSREKAWLDLFLPDTLLNKDSIVRRMVADIPEDDWQDIEIVGWLYQFYISERKDEVFAQKGKYSPRDIPAATQLFTPHWIVRYMVENSLGRVWLEAHPESGLREHMPYYLESENPAPPPNPDLTPEDLSVMDPACGSGHILVYAFDLLAHIYRERGYAERDIPALILEHNLHGLDIDERAAQLASFAVVMKARDLNSRLFRRDMPALNILQVRPTRGLALPNAGGRDMLGHYSTLSGGLNDADALNPNDWQPLLDAFADADHLGSLITPPAFDAGRLRAQLRWLEERGGLDAGALDDLRHLLKQAELLARKYDAVVANPPYMGSGSHNSVIRSFGETLRPDAKSDLFSLFIYKCVEMSKNQRLISLITPPTWLFTITYADFREHLIKKSYILSLLNNGRGLWGSDLGTCVFVLKNTQDNNLDGIYIKLYDHHGEVSNSDEMESRYFSKRRIKFNQNLFGMIPSSPLAYWVTKDFLEIYSDGHKISDVAFADGKNVTGNNDRFMRHIWEVSGDLIQLQWQIYHKGGEFRKWYGNYEYVVDRSQRAIDYYSKSKISRLIGRYLWNKPGICWTYVTNGTCSFRILPQGYTFDSTGLTMFFHDEAEIPNLLSYLNAKSALYAINLTQSISYTYERVLNLSVLSGPEINVTGQAIALSYLISAPEPGRIR